MFELYASGRENGVVVGVGAQCSYAVLMHEGLHDPRTLLRSSVAGEALDAWTAQLLGGAGGAAIELGDACKLKEKLGVLADHGGACPAELMAETFELPDGRKLNVSPQQRTQITAPLFEPGLLGEACGGAHRNTWKLRRAHSEGKILKQFQGICGLSVGARAKGTSTSIVKAHMEAV